MANLTDLINEIEELCKDIDSLTIRKATDLENLPTSIKEKLREACNTNITDAALIEFAEGMGIKHLFPEDRVADIFRIWLKVTGFIKPAGSDDNNIPVMAYIDMAAEGFLNGNPNQTMKSEDILNALDLRLATVSEMFLKTSELRDKVKEKVESDKLPS